MTETVYYTDSTPPAAFETLADSTMSLRLAMDGCITGTYEDECGSDPDYSKITPRI